MKSSIRSLVALSVLSLSTSSFAVEKNMMVRMRMLSVMPVESGTPTVVGGKVRLSDSAVPEVDLTYFFTESFAAELILATSPHSASVKNSSSNGLDLGTVNLLPPTLLGQYHKEFGNWKPYVGAGINYTVFFDGKPGAMKEVRYKNGFGYAFQIGTDYKIAENTYINFDIKKLYISTDVTANTYSGAQVKADVDINPWLVGMGIGYRF